MKKMAIKHWATEEVEIRKVPLPPPVEGGTGYFSSRGRFIDWLMGDARMEAKARSLGELRAKEGLGEEDVSEQADSEPEDPPQVELPPPVEEGTGTETKGN